MDLDQLLSEFDGIDTKSSKQNISRPQNNTRSSNTSLNDLDSAKKKKIK